MKKKIHPETLATEKQLASRLKKMGQLLLVFSLGFFVYASVERPSPYEDGVKTAGESTLSSGLSSAEKEDLDPHEIFNFFAISFVFGGIGIACILGALKKSQNIRKP